jgi:glycosyltransferase involved in cell wall biosynthesis
MDSPLVSIIIPCFNQGRFLAEAIESALAQSYRNIEIIVIDSGSTDETADVMTRYADRIRTITIENRGVSHARNAGIAISTGELIALLDADDRWLPDKLSYQVPRLMELPDAALLYSSYRIFTLDGKYHPVPVKDGFRPTLHDQLHFNHVNCQTALFRRSMVDVVGMFDESLARAEDWDLWNRIVVRAPIIGTSQICAEYRRYPGTLSTNARQMLASTLRVLSKSRSLHANCAECELAIRRGVREAHAVYGASLCAESRSHLRSGRWLAGAGLRVAGLWHNPRAPLNRFSRRTQTT